MRRTLIVVIVLVIIALAVIVVPVEAGELNWSAGVTLTEKESAINIGSLIEASRGDRLIGCWFSSTGQLPIMVRGLEYNAFGQFPGIRNIQKVVLSPDHGLTEWPAELVEGKGYCVPIPNLQVGGYGLEWGITSKDKKNRLMLVIIPINWSSTRVSSATNQTMVQEKPDGCYGFSDAQWYCQLKPGGFIPAKASFDPANVAYQQAATAVSNQVSQPQQVATLAPTISPKYQPEPTRYAPIAKETEEIMMVLKGNTPAEFPVTISAGLEKDDKLVFRRNDRFIAEATITEVVSGRFIEAKITKGSGVRSQDSIFIKGGK